MATNKVHYDLSNVHFAPITDGAYDTPIKLGGAISMDLSAEGETGKLRADGTDYYVYNSNNGYSGDLNFALIPEVFRIEALGEELTEEKVLIENALKDGKAFALLFEFFGDQKHTRHVLYNCHSARPSIVGENKENQKEADTETVTITASPDEEGNVKVSTTPETPATVYDTWFAKVYKKGAVSPAKAGK